MNYPNHPGFSPEYERYIGSEDRFDFYLRRTTLMHPLHVVVYTGPHYADWILLRNGHWISMAGSEHLIWETPDDIKRLGEAYLHLHT